jgi:hypothetical protein
VIASAVNWHSSKYMIKVSVAITMHAFENLTFSWPNFTAKLQCHAVLIIGFNNTSYSVLESAQNVTLTIQVRGGVNRCNQTEWMLDYIVRNVFPQCT